jgi:biopolymer transport protein ExbB
MLYFPKFLPVLLASLSLLLVGTLHAQLEKSSDSFSSVASKAENDYQLAEKQLRDIRSLISSEMRPLVEDVQGLDEERARLRKDLEKLRIEELTRSKNQLTVASQLKALEENEKYITGLLGEFVGTFQSRIHPAENQLYQTVIDGVFESTSPESPTNGAQRVREQLKLLEIAIKQLESVTGGHIFEGKALTPKGFEEDGKFALLGPQAFFAGDNAAGITMLTAANSSRPTIVDLGDEAAQGIRRLVETGTGIIPADPTLGKAIKIEQSSETIAEHVSKGGAVGYTIVGLGIVSLLIGLFKWIEISSYNVPSSGEINSVLGYLMAGKDNAAEKAAANLKGTAGDMIRIGVERFQGKRAVVEELFYEKLLAIRPKLERMLPFLAVTAAAAPLMGLLGTVMGMIQTFKMIELFGAGDPKALSGGISAALVTTELGLVVAIPTLIIHGILARMARGKVGRMEGAAVAFLNGMSERRLRDSIQAREGTEKADKAKAIAKVNPEDKADNDK